MKRTFFLCSLCSLLLIIPDGFSRTYDCRPSAIKEIAREVVLFELLGRRLPLTKNLVSSKYKFTYFNPEAPTSGITEHPLSKKMLTAKNDSQKILAIKKETERRYRITYTVTLDTGENSTQNIVFYLNRPKEIKAHDGCVNIVGNPEELIVFRSKN